MRVNNEVAKEVVPIIVGVRLCWISFRGYVHEIVMTSLRFAVTGRGLSAETRSCDAVIARAVLGWRHIRVAQGDAQNNHDSFRESTSHCKICVGMLMMVAIGLAITRHTGCAIRSSNLSVPVPSSQQPITFASSALQSSINLGPTWYIQHLANSDNTTSQPRLDYHKEILVPNQHLFIPLPTCDPLRVRTH